MGRCIPGIQGLAGLFIMAVVHEWLHFMHVLVEAAAQGDVHFLKPAADAQHGNARNDGRIQQRQGRGIPCRIMSSARRAGRSLIMERFDIGGGAGKEDAVQTVQNIGRGKQLRQGRKNHRHALGCAGYCLDILVATDVIGMQTDLPGAGGDAD